MLATTLKLIKAAYEADPSISAGERRRLLAVNRKGVPTNEPENTKPHLERLVRRKEGAARLGISPRTFDKLCNEGALTKRRLPGRVRAAGVLESELLSLINQETDGIGKFPIRGVGGEFPGDAREGRTSKLTEERT